MDFIKLQGTGNDFVVIDARSLSGVRWSALARKMCDRHFGIGADGIILILNSKTADLRMRIFNADGSEAEICGNGLRCFSKFVNDTGILHKKKFAVETLAGIKIIENYYNRSGKVSKVKVMMGVPQFNASSIPVADCKLQEVKSKQFYQTYNEMALTINNSTVEPAFVSMGNPHAVYFLDQPVETYPLTTIGPLVEHHKVFPERTNFEVARVISPKEINVRVWERGVGETLACGSGACAVAVMAMLKGYAEQAVDIKLPGGVLTITWHGSGSVSLTGPAEQVFTGIWPD